MITFKDIRLSYNNKTIFEQLSFNINRGDKVAILGKSGLGKSSLIHLILGFTQSQSGKILFDGNIVDEKTVWDIRKQVAYVDQDVSIGEGKVLNWIHSIFDYKTNAPETFPQKEMEQLLDYFEIDQDDLEKNIEELSGGERQRLAIIVSILLKREVFLFDEITSALDRNLKDKVVSFFTNKKDWTVIVISHDSVWLDHPDVKVFNLKDKTWEP